MKLSALIADDSPQSRELLRVVLEHAGFSVVEATNGREAVEIAGRLAPDVIVLDLQMPILDGYGAVAELRSNPHFTAAPILALTAHAMDGDREKALAAGFSEYLTKPVGLTQLRRVLAQLTGKAL